MNVNFHSVYDNGLPSEQEFDNIPALELVADADNADALRRQLILPPALPVAPTTDTPDPEPPPDIDIPLPDPFIPETPDPHNEIGSTYDEVGNILYWYNIQQKDGDMKLVMVETMHYSCMKQMLYMEVRDPVFLPHMIRPSLFPCGRQLPAFSWRSSRSTTACCLCTLTANTLSQ